MSAKPDLSPIANVPDDSELTKVECPLCKGAITPEQRVDLMRAHELLHSHASHHDEEP